MRQFRNILMTAALVITGILVSCGGSDDSPGLTAGQRLVNALASGDYALNTSSSDVDAEGVTDLSGVSISLSDGGTNSSGVSTVNFTLSGTGITPYLTGGSFLVDEEGNVSTPSLSATSQLAVTALDVDADDSGVIIDATVGAASRSTGVGTWYLVFD